MKKFIIFCLFSVCGLTAHAQVAAAAGASASAAADSERARISSERSRLEAKFVAEDSACYKKFLVNQCLDEIKPRRRDALTDLKRQEVLLDAQERKARGGEQIRKTEEKSSPEKQQEAAVRRTDSLKDFEARMDREKQKNADRAMTQANEKTSSDAAVNRTKNSQEKAVGRAEKRAASAEEVRKFTERQEKGKERLARHARDKLNETKPPSAPLPLPP